MAGGQADAIISMVDGRWVSANSASGFEEFASFADRSFLVDEVLKPENTPTKGTSKTVEGVECLALDDGKEGTLYLAADDGRPIQIDDPKDQGDLTFSYEDQDAPKAPAASEVVDLSKLAG
jgi:hypothetical protein